MLVGFRSDDEKALGGLSNALVRRRKVTLYSERIITGALLSRWLLWVVGCCSPAFTSSRNGTLTRCAPLLAAPSVHTALILAALSATPSTTFAISHHPPIVSLCSLLFALRLRNRTRYQMGRSSATRPQYAGPGAALQPAEPRADAGEDALKRAAIVRERRIAVQHVTLCVVLRVGMWSG
jgi:hypothetical protein